MDESLTTIKGVGPGREKQLHKLGINNITSLLTYFPRTYEDRRTIYKIGDLKTGMTGGVVGVVSGIQEKRPRSRLSILDIVITDGTGSLKIVLFNQGYKKNFYKIGQRLYVYGKAEFQYGAMQMNTPQIENLGEFAEPDRGIVPIYALADGVSQFVVRSAVRNWFQSHEAMDEILPEEILSNHQYMNRYDAFKAMHFPESSEQYELARHQLAYEELFVMQAGLALLRNKEQRHKGFKMEPNGVLIERCIEELPFSLTGDQERAFQDISSDMEDERPMQRLLQGDVGSGKTVVATLSLIKAVENGFQGALMAPTEILAAQHYEGIRNLCDNLEISIELLTGSTGKKEKERIYAGLADGTISIVVGTHALIQEGVQFSKLGLIVIDEQHRFGVEQRARLQKKGEYPHVLIMTATPIPRTMTLSVYGDLAVSLIKEMPPGRKPVRTYVVDGSYTERLRTFFGKEMAEGRQVYVVCPLVEESEKLDLQAAEELYIELKNYFYKTFNVGLIHGRMKPDEKETIMNDFYNGDISLLVSTTVIEVGVNVPNATIMCIEGAERFGLSQLHQLRGRVGRGTAQSYCILVSDAKNDLTRERLKLMEQIQDGFELAEQDLLLRGSGQLFGLVQSGLPDLRVANIIKDIDILVKARQDVLHYAEAFGMERLESVMKPELEKRFGEKFLRILYN
ncbi:DNA helicase RecG [Veillonella denticariosi JCM 15641]|uniref:ATP-dependent DNA helicase RecG n=1 Tax=Veillonella denticariosi JCM 15641 TaxID=1298594 RepID=A0A2S7Z7E7_9FIRM|nr:ATP-dependent DNA helicase RecG [Veillonella denticariosi]PQL19232.1 DNA helicase RecG [Veillonella denticariosi JCM 15641]